MVNTTFEKFLMELSKRVYQDEKLRALGNQLGLRGFEIGGIKYDNLSRDGKIKTENMYIWLILIITKTTTKLKVYFVKHGGVSD